MAVVVHSRGDTFLCMCSPCPLLLPGFPGNSVMALRRGEKVSSRQNKGYCISRARKYYAPRYQKGDPGLATVSALLNLHLDLGGNIDNLVVYADNRFWIGLSKPFRPALHSPAICHCIRCGVRHRMDRGYVQSAEFMCPMYFDDRCN